MYLLTEFTRQLIEQAELQQTAMQILQEEVDLMRDLMNF